VNAGLSIHNTDRHNKRPTHIDTSINAATQLSLPFVSSSC
jgi:hypothetical protein